MPFSVGVIERSICERDQPEGGLPERVHIKMEPFDEGAIRVKYEPLYVKPEPTCESSATACVKPEPGAGVSAAAARAGLYSGHEVCAGLYSGHEVRGELVLGPVSLEQTTHQLHIKMEAAADAARVGEQRRSESEMEAQGVLPVVAAGPRPRAPSPPRPRGAPARCRVCTKTFDRPSKLSEHMRSHTGEKPYPCNMCGRRFSRRNHLKRHEALHTGQKPHSCQICPKEFPGVKLLGRHERMHTRTVSGELKAEKPTVLHEQVLSAEKRYSEMCTLKPPPTCEQQRAPGESGEPTQSAENVYSSGRRGPSASAAKHVCGVCTKKFKGPSKLREHMRVHTRETPYFCKMCGKLFQRLHHLRRHEFLHTGQKPHSCGTCEKKFAELQTLKLHERTHTGVKPHSCSVCNKSFKQLTTLRIHELIHTGEKPFSCKTCSMKFRHSSALARHARVHTGHRPYTCDTCKQTFAQRHSLKRHERVHTGETPTPARCGTDSFQT